MITDEARELLSTALGSWTSRGHTELARQDGYRESVRVKGGSGTIYQIQIQIVWDGPPKGDIRVNANMDDGGWRAILPVADSSLVSNDSPAN